MSLQYNMSAGRSLRAWSRRAMAQFHYIRKMKTMYVYLLHCSDGTYYTGVTNNIER